MNIAIEKQAFVRSALEKAEGKHEILVELVDRMQKLRWSRFDDFLLTLAPPDEDGWKAIQAIVGVSPECGPGWYDLLLAAAEWIVETGGDPRASQIKEKFGTLRWYYHADARPLGDEIIEAAERLSGRICDVCGAPGRTSGKGWLATRCGEHVND
jgi:hypothetical protein